MPSHLTRHVFRRILANEPILHRGCLRRQAYTTSKRISVPTPRCTWRHGSFAVSRPQRRTLFNFSMFGSKKRDTKEADMDPGIEDMMHLAKVQRMKARLPPTEEVAAAFALFFKHKHNRKDTITDTQAQLAFQAWRFCLDADQSNAPPLIAGLTLRQAAWVLAFAKYRRAPSSSHVELAKAFYEYAASGDVKAHALRRRLIKSYVKLLSATGQASQARQVVADVERSQLDLGHAGRGSKENIEAVRELTSPGTDNEDGSPRYNLSLWSEVLRGFSGGNDEGELLATLDTIKNHWPDVQHSTITRSMFEFYVRQNKSDEVKKWFLETWQLQAESDDLNNEEAGVADQMGFDLTHLLQWCLRNNEMEFGHQAVRQAMSKNPPKPVWDAIFVWAAGTGKGADEIGRMMTVMEKSNESITNPDEWRLPDTTTINGLVEFATSKSDPYLAERFIVLGKDKGIEPDARTYQLQMDYRLKIDDVDGALIAYKNLQAMDLSSGEDITTVNRLIVAMCRSKRHDFDTVMNVAMDLSDRRARFEPETVSTLAILHLSRDEMHDVIDLLNTHSYHYSSAERAGIRNHIIDFCVNPKTPTSRSWDAYTVIRNVFDETSREQRTEMMQDFFRRERPDMAVNIFNEMRRHSRRDTIPTVETYVAAFMGSAKLRHLDSLEATHNQLKLDYNIDVNTYLNNALLLAYTACDQPRKALSFWSDIAASQEGPTYNSIHIALRACEKSPFGDIRAKEIWVKLRKMKVDLDQSMWASYVAALAGNGDNELAIRTVEEAEAKSEVEVDPFLIGSLCAGANNSEKQEEIEQWAKEKYPEIWAELEKLGVQFDEEERRRVYKIDRSLTP